MILYYWIIAFLMGLWQPTTPPKSDLCQPRAEQGLTNRSPVC